MLRRLSVLLVSLLALGACSGSSRVAVDAGDSSLTRAELIALTTSLRNQGDLEVATVVTEALNSDATAYLRSQAFLAYFESEGLVSEDALGTAKDAINDAVLAGNINELGIESNEFDALSEIIMVDTLLAETGIGTLNPGFDLDFPDQAAILEEFSDGFSVESRLGTWDSETATVFSR